MENQHLTKGYSVQSPLVGDKYLGAHFNLLVSKTISKFIGFHDRFSGVRY
jgi:hypothetical protein